MACAESWAVRRHTNPVLCLAWHAHWHTAQASCAAPLRLISGARKARCAANPARIPTGGEFPHAPSCCKCNCYVQYVGLSLLPP